jgi:tetratricopeptide (TPR) repeat protein
LNFRAKSVCLGAVAFGGLILVAPAYGSIHKVETVRQQAGLRGGQAPANASGGTGRFLVVVARNLPADTANSLRQDLVSDGFTTAETRPDSAGNMQVVLGGIPTNEQATSLLQDLRSSGYTPESVSEDSGNAPADGAAQPQTVYRVKVAEFDSAEEAESASQTLAADGFVNVDVVQENGKHMLMLGTFNRREDAEALLSDVARAGFALAEVASRERLRGTATATAGSADLSALPAAEQAGARDVLSMAEKVESGEATAAEIKELRDRIQRLSESQRNVVAREENTRATEREKMAKIFPLYRQFDRALTTGDLAAAEQALAEVRQIDPTDIFLQGRVRQLEQARSGGSGTAGTGQKADPAEVQRTINEARKLEAEGNRPAALEKYREAAAMDPNNSDARGKIAELSTVASGGSVADDGSSEGAGGIIQNKPLLYGAGALLALIVLALLFKARRKKDEPAPAERETAYGGGTGPDFIDPLATDSAYSASSSPDFSALGTAPTDSTALQSGAGGAEMAPPAFATFGMEDDEEEAPKPAPAPRPAPVEEESDTVSFDNFDAEPAVISTTPTPMPGVPAIDTEEPLSINFSDEDSPAPASASASATPAKGTSALDADLESLLKGTFPGAPAAAAADTPLASASPGMGVEDLQPVGAPAAAESRLVFEQSFDDEPEGAAPQGWRGEYDYASLTVERLDEASHAQVLCFHKTQGSGSATYHLTFPKATGRVTAEFDIRCDQKNKFLLGVYLEKDEDFKQSIHTIVHQLDPNAPAALRIQGVAAPYAMATWRHVRFEIDLSNATIDGYIDNEQVLAGTTLPNAPEYVNTLSIRDNLATTGTLLLDNIRISEA